VHGELRIEDTVVPTHDLLLRLLELVLRLLQVLELLLADVLALLGLLALAGA
jgi:hypothetical protein